MKKKYKGLREKKLHLYKIKQTCRYCGVKFKSEMSATIDHIIPRSKGGSNAMENLTLACKDCNNRKGSRVWHKLDQIAVTPVESLLVPKLGLLD